MNNTKISSLKTKIQELEKEKVRIQEQINNLKLEIADLVLMEEYKEDSEPKIKFVSIVFDSNKPNAKSYDYIWDSEYNVAIGDEVQVETRWGKTQIVTVVNIFEENESDIDISEYKCADPL